MSAALLELRDVTKSFPGVTAMDRVSVAFRPGEVHAVIGENGAGKSTMMNILSGELQPNSGTILVDGKPVVIGSALASQRLGIRVVYQELSLCENLTVGENVLMGRFARRHALSLLNRRRAAEGAREALERLGLTDIGIHDPVSSLSIAQKQMVEIARAISQDARILVLDEPNSALSPTESQRLFDIVRALRARGVTVLYVSHHLDEVRALADRISVMRDGQLQVTLENGAHLTSADLVAHMVGRAVNTAAQYSRLARPAPADSMPALAIRDLAVPGRIDGISFTVAPGEIVGVAGLPDSGKDILADAIFGLVPRSGTVEIGGIRLLPSRPSHAIAAGIALIPADRRGAGALLTMSVAENIVSSTLQRFSSLGLLRRGEIRNAARRYAGDLRAKVSDFGQRIGTLSGGNQQKIILARGLVSKPRLLILHEPTRGIDVGAKAEIYDILKTLAADGLAILMVSSELPEIVLHSGRVIVMANRRVTGELAGADLTEEAVMSLATTKAEPHAA
jgi:ABC-type sugar transport system ATPase subunit